MNDADALKIPKFVQRVFKLLHRCPYGSLTVTGPQGEVWRFGQYQPYNGELHHAQIQIHDWNCDKLAMQSGDIGFAQGYRDKLWSTTDVPCLLRYFLANREYAEAIIYGSWWGRILYRINHLFNRNSKNQAKKNIHAHYDLGNNFYKTWLDSSMNYSSAWFAGVWDGDLRQAQEAKMRRALLSCGIPAREKNAQEPHSPGTRLLEIGCGWGAVAELAAKEFGAHTTGVTLSTEQLDFAKQRLQKVGLEHYADLRLQDYRDLPQEFSEQPVDALISIEMFEAVGKAYWPSYFSCVKRCLKPGGKACIQTITIDDSLYERYLSGTDFIQQYIFPGGCLPSLSAFRQSAEEAGLRVVDTFSLRLDYAETLRRWRSCFLEQQIPVRDLGFDEPFIRIWEFYLAYCEAAFDMKSTDVWQITLENPR
jgi:cyclopropane-fatty-acyl-phospholipid synthase